MNQARGDRALQGEDRRATDTGETLGHRQSTQRLPRGTHTEPPVHACTVTGTAGAFGVVVGLLLGHADHSGTSAGHYR